MSEPESDVQPAWVDPMLTALAAIEAERDVAWRAYAASCLRGTLSRIYEPAATIRAIVCAVPESSRMNVVWELRRLEEWLCRQMQEDAE